MQVGLIYPISSVISEHVFSIGLCLQSIFDFDLIKSLMNRPDFR